MSTISEFMMEDHRQCDQRLAAAEEAVSGEEWETAGREFSGFREALERHIDMEEDILFPEFEQRTGLTGGPTMVMRSEHEEIRRLLEQLQMALEASDPDAYLGTSETLMVMLQQHNMKEENMLYPMADGKLGDAAGGVLERMQAL